MRRFISILLCSVLLFTGFVYFSPDKTAHAATRQELQEQISRIEGELKENKQKLNELKDKKESQKEYLEALKSRISSTEEKATNLRTQVQTLDSEITVINQNLKKLNTEIDVINDEITLAQQQIVTTSENIDASKNQLSQKLRAAYITGNDSTIKILMGADSLASFLSRLEMMKRMSENDRKVIDDFTKEVKLLKKSKATLEEKEKELETKRVDIENSRKERIDRKNELNKKQSEYESTVKELEGDYKNIEGYISKLDKSGAVYENYIKNLERERADADRQIEEIIKSYQATTQPTTQGTTAHVGNIDPTGSPLTTSAPNGGHPGTTGVPYASTDSWAWPLGSASCYIISGYGNRSASISGWSFHGGIDITGNKIYGAPVYASRGGRVISAIWSNRGYGNYVVIDHGDGFSTVYGHCSSLSVSNGQQVSKGQHIANVGSTGNSTGPHLHFEVRYGGAKQNPSNYVSHP